LSPSLIGADGYLISPVACQLLSVVASRNVLIRDRMASLRLENWDLSFVSKAFTSSFGALNSTSSICALVLFSFLGNVELLSPLRAYFWWHDSFANRQRSV